MFGPKLTYQHFCPAARALEVIGEKWSLLIVRDLLAGQRRFADLRRSLSAITAKGLSERLRDLEEAGVVEREAAGQREVWYRLTPKGQALAPIVEDLVVWGIEYALRPPRPGESINPTRATAAFITYLNRRGVLLSHPVTWVVRFSGVGSDTIQFDGKRWSQRPGEEAADVVIDTTPQTWATFLSSPPAERQRWLTEMRAEGTTERLEEFARTMGRPESHDPRRP